METRSVPATPLQYGRHSSSVGVNAAAATSEHNPLASDSVGTGTGTVPSPASNPSHHAISQGVHSNTINATPHATKQGYVIQSVSAPVTPALTYSSIAPSLTPAASSPASGQVPSAGVRTPATVRQATATAPIPIDAASLQLLQERVAAEQKRMATLISRAELLKSTSATPSGTPASVSSSLLPPPHPQSAVKPSPPSLHGRPVMSFSPSPPPPISEARSGPPLIPAATATQLLQSTPIRTTLPFPATTPLSPIEEKYTVVQNLNDSFASVASDTSPSLTAAGGSHSSKSETDSAVLNATVQFPLLASNEQKVSFNTPSHPSAPSISDSSPAVSLSASPSIHLGNSPMNLHPRSTPSPTTLKSIIASQRENMQRAGVYGEQLLSEIDLLQTENDQLKSQLQAVQSQAQVAAAQAVTLKAMSEFMRAEILTANANHRSSINRVDPPLSKSFEFTGQFGTDFNTFQSLMRLQRKSMRDLHESVDSQRDEFARLQNEHEISQRNLIQSNHHSHHLASEVDRLQQERDELDIEVSTLQTKFQIQHSQHQCETHVLQEQIASLKEEGHNELEKLKEDEFEKRQQLEGQIGILKLTIQRLESAATAETFNESVSQHLMSPIPKPESSSIQPSSSKAAAKTPSATPAKAISSSPTTTVSLASDLGTADESEHQTQHSSNPTSTTSSDPLRDELEHLLRVEKNRRNLRESWAAEEEMWYLERLRLREMERQAAEMRKEEAIAERQLFEQSRVNHHSEESEQQWKDKVSDLKQEIRSLQQSHESTLNKTIANYTKQLLEKEDEVTGLRQQLKTSIATASSGSAVSTSHVSGDSALGSGLDPDALSTPMLQRTARGETSHIITPPLSHFRNSHQSHQHGHHHPTHTTRDIPISAGSKGVPPDSRFSQFDTPFTPFSHSPVSSVSSSTSGLSLDLSQTTEMLSDLQTDLQQSTDRTQETLAQVSSEVKVSGNSTRRLFTILFCVQIVVTGAWLLLTSGGSSELLDHPLMQAVLLFADQKSLSDVSALFMA